MAPIVVHFRRYTGETLDMDCDDEFTAKIMAQLLAEQLGKDPHAVYLKIGQRILDPLKTLAALGVRNGMTLDVQEMDVQLLRSNIPNQSQVRMMQMRQAVLDQHPEFLVPTTLLYVHMNPVGSSVQGFFLIDTGASRSVLDISYARRAGLEGDIDLQSQSNLVGVGSATSVGTLWLADFLVNDSQGHRVALPASFVVV